LLDVGHLRKLLDQHPVPRLGLAEILLEQRPCLVVHLSSTARSAQARAHDRRRALWGRWFYRDRMVPHERIIVRNP